MDRLASAPARPAIDADNANTPILVRVRSRPSVAHATGLSFIAMSRRPYEPRRNQMTKVPSSANTTASRRACCWLVVGSNTPRSRPGTLTVPPATSFVWENTTFDMRTEKAAVPSAR